MSPSRALRAPLRVLLAASAFLAAAAPRPAYAQTSQDVIFHSNLDEHAGYSDVWGYTAPNGDEYALLATWSGVAVINVTDPVLPYETGFFAGAFSNWRDIKTYQNHAYITNESSGGLTILDLSDPENPVERPSYTGFSTAHNLFIEETTARCYIAGSNIGRGGLRVLSLADPENPVEIGSWENTYLHDVVVNGTRLYGSAIFAGQLIILDVTNPAAIPLSLGIIQNYPSAFTHNAWMTADDSFVMTTDEVAGASVRMWDITNPAAPIQTDSYRPNPAGAPHNAIIDGDLAFISHYTAGVRVVDVSDPLALTEVGFYDTYAAGNGSTFDGCWGVFPFFGSTPGLFVASDIQSGLYVLEYRGPLGAVTGTVTEAGTGAPVPGVEMRLAESDLSTLTLADGTYFLQDTGGNKTLDASVYGFTTASQGVTVTVGATATVDLTLSRLPGAGVTGAVLDAQTALPVPGATVEVLGTPLVRTADASGVYDHAAVPAGTYTLRAFAFGYDRPDVEVTVIAGVDQTLDFALTPALLTDDFETVQAGWTVTGTATTGMWERADPEATYEGTEIVQPEDDFSPAGVNAWVTGALAGAAIGQYDVDNGETVLTSPLLDLSGATAPRVTYRRWYCTGLGNPTTDVFTVEASSDGGSSWVTLESTAQRKTEWTLVDRAVGDLLVPTAQVQFRFTARDTGVGSITEAAIDEFMVYDTSGAVGTTAPAVGTAGARLRLSSAFPNPARAAEGTHFALALPAPRRVEAAVYDVQGRRVASVARGRLPAGPHQIRWDGRNTRGVPVPAGVYFLRLESREGSESRKIVLLR